MRRVAVALLVAAAVGCDRPPSPSEAREWTPQDHDRIEENARAAQGQRPGQEGAQPMAMPSGQQRDQLIGQLWAGVCAECHGASGRGDGPRGAELKPPNLADPAWQAKVSDAEIVATIRNGKGKMPKYERLPEPFVNGLVQRIRSFKSP